MATLSKLNISLIQPSAMNPRKTFDQTLIEELAQNIAEQGLLQPITVRGIEWHDFLDPETDEVVSEPVKYEVVCGERRFRAWLHLYTKKPVDYTEIPCIVREMTDKEAFDAMITENLQRKDVDPIEEATAISLLKKRGDSTAEIAARLGKTERFVTDRVKLASLIPELAKVLQDGSIPLTGAMMLAKLDEEKQKEYLAYTRGEDDTVGHIKEWIERSFGELPSNQFYEEDGFDESLPLCSKCPNNTANFGCLFYEMKCETPQCTNRVCMRDKETAFMLYKVKQNMDVLVKEGEEFQTGKTLVSVENPESWWGETDIKYRNEFVEKLKEMNVKVVDSSKVFRGRCYYKMDDARIDDILKSREGCRVLRFERVYGSRLKMIEEAWYFKDGQNGDTSVGKALEKEKIKEKMSRNDELKEEKILVKLVDLARDKREYSSKEEELTEAEELVFNVLLLKDCGYSFRRNIGLDSYDSTDEFKVAKKHSSLVNTWKRDFIKEKLSSVGPYSFSSLKKCIGILFKDQYPEEYKEVYDKFEKEYKKKNERLQEKLDSLKE